MKIGLLDFGIRENNLNSIEIIEDVIEYATLADKLGFNRFWISEHHNFNPTAGWLNPEVLLPIIAGLTENIRVGSGGILLRHHSPYRIAYTFKLMNNLFSDRIDLGIAKGYSSHKNLTFDDSFFNFNESLFDENLKALMEIYNKEDELFEKEIIIPPYKGSLPETWYLTGSYNHLQMIKTLGLSFTRSIFHNGSDVSFKKDELIKFKDEFFDEHGRSPKISLAFSGCCHINEKRAKKAYENKIFGFIPDNIVGSPSIFEEKLMEYEEDYGIDEFIFMNTALTSSDRKEGLELIMSKIKVDN